MIYNNAHALPCYRYFSFSVYATDNMGKTSAPFVFDIILCSGCSNHGVCNFTAFREGTKTTDAIKYVVCVCDGGEESYWTGT